MTAFDDWVSKKFGKPLPRKRLREMRAEMDVLRDRLAELGRWVDWSERRWAMRKDERERWYAIVAYLGKAKPQKKRR